MNYKEVTISAVRVVCLSQNSKKARLVIYKIALIIILVRNSNSIPWI